MILDIIWKFNQDCSDFFLLQYHCKKYIFLLRKRMEMSDTTICNAFNMYPYDTISFIILIFINLSIFIYHW